VFEAGCEGVRRDRIRSSKEEGNCRSGSRNEELVVWERGEEGAWMGLDGLEMGWYFGCEADVLSSVSD
jgi:hypothetical protein